MKSLCSIWIRPLLLKPTFLCPWSLKNSEECTDESLEAFTY